MQLLHFNLQNYTLSATILIRSSRMSEYSNHPVYDRSALNHLSLRFDSVVYM